MATVEVSRDHMRAELVLDPGERTTTEAVRDLLEAAGVSHGIQFDTLLGARQLVGPVGVAIAEGTPARPGEPASVAYAFPVGLRDLRPLIREDGRADFRQLGWVVNVQPGDELARKTPARAGTPGCTVRGQAFSPPVPADVGLHAGPGAALTADGLAVVATVAGNPHLDGQRVGVCQELLVPGDVSLATGHLHFEGDLQIAGGIQRQMQVTASGNVTVQGPVEGARIRAGGSVVVHGGVRADASIEAGGDVLVKFMERSRVRCSGSLGVAGDLLDCEVDVGGSLAVGGALIGGRATVGDRSEARAVGSRLGTPTAVLVIAPPSSSTERQALEAERNAIHAALERISPRVREAYAAMSEKGAPDVEAFRKVLELAARLQARDAELVQELEALPAPPATRLQLDVREALHPGVSLQIGQAHIRVTSETPPGSLVESAGKVRLLPLS